MISFTIITTSPAVLRNQMIARDILYERTAIDDPTDVRLVGVYDGTEWIEVPNPMKISGTGTDEDPYVPDPRRCFLIKMVRDAKAVEIEGEPDDGRPLILRTRLGKWVMNNSSADTLTSVDGRSWPSRKVGPSFWFVEHDDFGTWQ